MCLAVPMQLIEINGNSATVEIGGTQRIVRLDLLNQVPRIGDYVIVHAGFALHLIDEQEARITLNYFKEMLAYAVEIPE
jgi:hydrogenase expression/formation protein HypC